MVAEPAAEGAAGGAAGTVGSARAGSCREVGCEIPKIPRDGREDTVMEC
jgi:hypothetical protein